MKKKNLFRTSALTAIVSTVLAVGSSVAGNVLVNGDFQTGDLTGWSTFTTANGTTGGAAPVASFDTTGTGAALAAQFQVGATVFGGQQGGGLTQTFTVGAGTYSISANVAADFVNMNESGGVFSIYLDSVLLDTFNSGSATTSGTIIRHSFSDTVTGESAGSHTLEILVTRPFNTSSGTPLQYVDNVSVDASAASVATPEPATLAMVLSSGLAGAVLFVRGRRKAASV